MPAALALAEDLGSSGAAFLDAVAAGYEAMGRAGIAVGPSAHVLGGFHPTSMSGGMAKRVHAARAAEGGLTAARLAADGFAGAGDGLAGTYGFTTVFTSDPDPERLTERLGERWMLDEITIKPWAACSDIHPMIQVTQELCTAHALTADHIDRIEATGPTKAARQNSLDGTVSVMAAQYSGPWNVAAAILADPADPSTYDPDRIAAPDFAALQAKVVSIDPAPQWDATYGWKMGGRCASPSPTVACWSDRSTASGVPCTTRSPRPTSRPRPGCWWANGRRPRGGWVAELADATTVDLAALGPI